MRECAGALWPCAMTGAASSLCGIEGLGVIVHGSSGCYYYPATVLHTRIHGTFLIEEDIIFGSEMRLLETVNQIRDDYERIAVITTCTPSVIGEDIRRILEGTDVLVFDSPGFSGNLEEGYLAAASGLPVNTSPGIFGVNIDGICLLDPFSRGNLQEARRLLDMAGIPVSVTFCSDTLRNLATASPFTITTNPDLTSGWGEHLGGLLGLDATADTLGMLERIFDLPISSALESEIAGAEERIVAACDKFLRRYNPPSVAIFGGFSYSVFAASMVTRYLDAEVTCIGSRNRIRPSHFRVEEAWDLSSVTGIISRDSPDLVLGSAFEQSLCQTCTFMPFTQPIRGRIQLRARPLIGVEGTLEFMEDVLNASMNHRGKVNA